MSVLEIKSSDELDEHIASLGVVEPYVKDAYNKAVCDKAAFIMLRKTGLGGSDSSIVLNVNPFKTHADLIKDKTATYPTQEELAIGEKPNVRKGSDLEPLILGKAEEWLGMPVHKPTTMYRFLSPSCLTVNYDGVVLTDTVCFPVEAKLVSQWAEKYWDVSKALSNPLAKSLPKIVGGTLENHIIEASKLYGIPPYYYTQVQQEMLGLNAPYGYVAAMFDRMWEFKMFLIHRDDFVCEMLKIEGPRLWTDIKQRNSRT